MADVVAVSGATGFIGSALVRLMLEQGRDVRALVEPGANPRHLDDLPESLAKRLDRVEVDVCDFVGMARALDGCEAFHHLAAVYRIWMPDPEPLYRVNLEGTTVALLAAQAAKVKRVVYTASIAAVGHRDDGPSDETTPWNLHPVANPYILSKHQSERIALRFAESGMPVVVVNPAFPFGPRDAAPTPTGQMILSLLQRKVPAVAAGGFCAIDVGDVAAGHLAAETLGRVGERYILGNHNVTFEEFAGVVCRLGGVPAPKLRVPALVGSAVALGFELWSDLVTHEHPLATYRSVRYLQRRVFFDPSKARRELGLPCTPLETSIERSIAYFRNAGMV